MASIADMYMYPLTGTIEMEKSQILGKTTLSRLVGQKANIDRPIHDKPGRNW